MGGNSSIAAAAMACIRGLESLELKETRSGLLSPRDLHTRYLFGLDLLGD